MDLLKALISFEALTRLKSYEQIIGIIVSFLIMYPLIRGYCNSIVVNSVKKRERHRRERDREKRKKELRKLFYAKYRDVLPKKFIILNYYITVAYPCFIIIILLGIFIEGIRQIGSIVVNYTCVLVFIIPIFVLALLSPKTGCLRFFENYK